MFWLKVEPESTPPRSQGLSGKGSGFTPPEAYKPAGVSSAPSAFSVILWYPLVQHVSPILHVTGYLETLKTYTTIMGLWIWEAYKSYLLLQACYTVKDRSCFHWWIPAQSFINPFDLRTTTPELHMIHNYTLLKYPFSQLLSALFCNSRITSI